MANRGRLLGQGEQEHRIACSEGTRHLELHGVRLALLPARCTAPHPPGDHCQDRPEPVVPPTVLMVSKLMSTGLRSRVYMLTVLVVASSLACTGGQPSGSPKYQTSIAANVAGDLENYIGVGACYAGGSVFTFDLTLPGSDSENVRPFGPAAMVEAPRRPSPSLVARRTPSLLGHPAPSAATNER